MTPLRALLRKEMTVLFASPIAYGVLTLVALLTALTFFEHLRLYNQVLFLYSSSTMGGFESDTIPDYVSLRDQVFFPVMEQLGLLLLLPIPLVTMRVFSEERSLGTDELLLTSGLSPTRIVFAKFTVTFGFVLLMMCTSLIYPATAILQGGLGLQHLLAVFLGRQENRLHSGGADQRGNRSRLAMGRARNDPPQFKLALLIDRRTGCPLD